MVVYFSDSNSSMKIFNEINILHQGAAPRFTRVASFAPQDSTLYLWNLTFRLNASFYFQWVHLEDLKNSPQITQITNSKKYISYENISASCEPTKKKKKWQQRTCPSIQPHVHVVCYERLFKIYNAVLVL